MKEKPDQSHALIDMYLKKSWFSRVMAWFWRFVVVALILLGMAFIGWRMLKPAQQHALRQKSALLNRTVKTLEDTGFLPIFDKPRLQDETQVASADDGREKQSGKTKASSAGKQSSNKQAETEKDHVIDLREPTHLSMADQGDPAGQKGSTQGSGIEKKEPQDVGQAPTTRIIEMNDKEMAERIAKQKAFNDLAKMERESRETETQKMLEKGGLSISWKLWNARHPVEWSDFQDRNIDQEITQWGAYIATQMIATNNGAEWVVFSVMERQRSWVRPGMRDPETLIHEQVHFDITELFARKLRALMKSQPRGDFRKMIQDTQLELSKTQSDYDNEAYTSEERQLFWEQRVAQGLKDTSSFAYFPDPQRLGRKKYFQGIFLLGQAYDHGDPSLEISDRLAKKWYQIGVQAEHTKAMNNLGALLLEDRAGETANPKQAFKLFLRASKLGQKNAMFNLGIMYWRGIGTEPNPAKAIEWFTKAADDVPYARKALKILEGPG